MELKVRQAHGIGYSAHLITRAIHKQPHRGHPSRQAAHKPLRGVNRDRSGALVIKDKANSVYPGLNCCVEIGLPG